ncbi:polyketide cyclase [Edaphobacter acidisoli]|uniref:Polyketide cyclase n=1 Tax=Edaphobacter acidisoli TaxID=2040573 RepID=A0A916RDW9_9BACT|nr:SRPBCC family protein [Edaphobacter acidisoli]GGA53082.1 polyketide cyclase [Edaphobacter acidisoli]
MLKTIGAIVVLAIVVVLFAAAMKPDTFVVERTTTINASPDKVTALVNDFHNWSKWSPWAQLDPEMKVTFSGAPNGVGAVYEWQGNSKVGSGRMEIASITPTKTTIKLDFVKPFASHSTANFLIEPEGTGTRVTWVMDGPMKFFPSKVMSVFMSMDKFLGQEFDKGLANMKSTAEHS